MMYSSRLTLAIVLLYSCGPTFGALKACAARYLQSAQYNVSRSRE